jgi:hypothetical protein
MMKYVFIIYKYENVFHIVIEIKNTHTVFSKPFYSDIYAI